MRRRLPRSLVTLALGLLVAALGAEAQPTGKTARIGYLTPVVGRNQVEEAFEQALHELGWSRGRNIQIESRYSGGRQDTIAPLVAELVGLKVDAIVAWSAGFGLAAKHATRQIPVVFLSMLGTPWTLGSYRTSPIPAAMSPASGSTTGGWTPQTWPRPTLLVNAKTYGKAVLHMTFEGRRDRSHASGDTYSRGFGD